jgi:hypothetical protein
MHPQTTTTHAFGTDASALEPGAGAGAGTGAGAGAGYAAGYLSCVAPDRSTTTSGGIGAGGPRAPAMDMGMGMDLDMDMDLDMGRPRPASAGPERVASRLHAGSTSTHAPPLWEDQVGDQSHSPLHHFINYDT